MMLLALLLGHQALTWDQPYPPDRSSDVEMIFECDIGGGWFVCGRIPLDFDSGPFGPAHVDRYSPLKLSMNPGLGQTVYVRCRGANSWGESPPSAAVSFEWPEVWTQ